MASPRASDSSPAGQSSPAIFTAAEVTFSVRGDEENENRLPADGLVLQDSGTNRQRAELPSPLDGLIVVADSSNDTIVPD